MASSLTTIIVVQTDWLRDEEGGNSREREVGWKSVVAGDGRGGKE